MKSLLRRSPVLLLALATGCGGGGKSSSSPVVGSWAVIEQGPLWADYQVGTIDYFEFAKDGTGSAFGRSEGLPIRGCGPFLYSDTGEGAITLDAPELVEGGGDDLIENRLSILQVRRSGNNLELENDGVVMRLTRVASVPDSIRCARAALGQAVKLPVNARYDTGLAFDGTRMIYSSDNGSNIAISPVTGTTAGGVALVGRILGTQGTDIWLQTDGDTFERRSPANVLVDGFSMTATYGSQLYTRSAAWDGEGLWISGYAYTPDYHSRLVKIDTAAEPEAFFPGQNFTISNDVYARIAATPTSLWVVADLMGPVLVELSPDDLSFRRAFDLPQRLQWASVVADGNTIYLLYFDYNAGGGYTYLVPVVVQ